MAQIKVELTGVSATLSQIDREYKSFLGRTAVALREELQKKTPIDSGNARSKWKESVKGNRVEVSNNVPYIERLEKNHSPQTRGQGIVRPAVASFYRRKI